jgi:hypothetical protein
VKPSKYVFVSISDLNSSKFYVPMIDESIFDGPHLIISLMYVCTIMLSTAAADGTYGGDGEDGGGTAQCRG